MLLIGFMLLNEVISHLHFWYGGKLFYEVLVCCKLNTC